MDDVQSERRTFLKVGAMAGAMLTAGTVGTRARADGRITKGDAAILRFLAAAEIIETDLWLQYAELGGTQNKEIPGLPTGGSAAYTAALQNLDGDMSQSRATSDSGRGRRKCLEMCANASCRRSVAEVFAW